MLCGAEENTTRASAMMLPQVGISLGKPRPRKLKIASSKIADAQTYVPCTTIGAIEFGSTCLSKIFHVGVPTEIAASMYGSSRIESTSARTSRVTRGISGTAIAIMTVESLAPHAATSAIASRIPGIAIMPSITRIRIASTRRK